jgi:hypothetical protein
MNNDVDLDGRHTSATNPERLVARVIVGFRRRE